MKEIILSGGFIVKVSDKDLERVNKYKWYVVKDHNCYYARTKVNNKNLMMHRYILNITDVSMYCDHKDHNGLNNTRSNIRVVTPSQNAMNRNKIPNLTSQYKGVYFDKSCNKFKAAIKLNGLPKTIGRFTNELDAALCYNKKALELFGEFAKLNII